MTARLSDAGIAARRERADVARTATALLAGWALPVGAVFLLIAAAAGTNGGYFPRTWGWIALPLAWTALVALIVRQRVTVSRAEVGFLVAMSAFVAWVAVSLLWTSDVPGTVLEVERDLIYPLAIAAGMLVLRRSRVDQTLGAVLAAIALIALYALGTRLFPDRIGVFRADDPVYVYRLGDPVGYWNALGIFCAIGLLLALGFAVRARHLGARVLAGAALPVLLTTIYFTYGRGAWIALAVGLAGAIALDFRRLGLTVSLLALSPAPVAAVWLASRSHGLTARGASLAEAARDGHRLAVWTALLVVAGGASAWALALAERRLRVGPRVRRAGSFGLAAAAAACVIAILAAYGGPAGVVRDAYDAFKSPPVGVKRGQSFNKRLFQLSSNGRVAEWRAAWGNYERHALLGSGAGSFEQYWLEHRPNGLRVRDAHSLYLEVLTELGPVGLALLAAGLLVPLAAGVRVRRRPLLPLAWGAYLAFVVHAGVDWDWEVVAVTAAALLVGLSLLVAGRREGASRALSVRTRAGAGVVLVAAAAFSIVGLLGNVPRANAGAAAEELRWERAVREADEAIRWSPWAGEPWQLRGRGERGLGDEAAARRSFLRALDRDPRDWSAWYDLGTVSRGLAASCAYATAARLNPLEPDVLVLRQKGLLPRDPEGDAALGCVSNTPKPN